MRPANLLAAVNKEFFESGAWESTYYGGVQIFKYPGDLWIYQEIIAEVRPSLLIEMGTCQGSSAAYFADLLDRFSGGRVVTVDIADQVKVRDPRVTYIQGSSLNPSVIDQVKRQAAGERCVMVSLDSEHLEHHVYAELEAYAGLVTPGSYLVTEDTFISQYGCQGVRFGGGSTWEAVCRWLPAHPEFQPDESREKFVLSMNPGGWLRRVR